MVFISILSSCNKQEKEPYNNAFVTIMDNNLSKTEVVWNRKDIAEYNFSLGGSSFKQDVTVNYSIIVGDGLTEGIDFQKVTNGSQIVIPKGIYEMPIRIKWLENELNNDLDNTIRIKIESVDPAYINIGRPGPDKNYSELIIEKVSE